MADTPGRRRNDPAGWLMDSIRDAGFEYLIGRYYGVYRAIVIDVSDPEQRGRVRAVVPALNQTEDGDVGPDLWALPVMPGLARGLSAQHGVFWPPDVGDPVWIMFEGGVPEKQVYIGGWLSKGDAGPMSSPDASVKGLGTKSGHTVRLSDADGDVSIRITKGDGSGGVDGTEVVMAHDGSVRIASKGGGSVAISGDGKTISAVSSDGARVDIGGGHAKLSDGAGSGVDAGPDGLRLFGSKVTIDAEVVDINATASLALGKGAVEPAVKGTSFLQKWQAHGHVVASPWGNTVPMSTTPVLVPGSDLSTVVKVG